MSSQPRQFGTCPLTFQLAPDPFGKKGEMRYGGMPCQGNKCELFVLGDCSLKGNFHKMILEQMQLIQQPGVGRSTAEPQGMSEEEAQEILRKEGLLDP